MKRRPARGRRSRRARLLRGWARARRTRPAWRKWFPVLAALGLLLLTPALTHAQGAVEDSVTLRWTAVGDDSLTGTAVEYALRMAPTPVTESNWDAATAVQELPAPLPSGTAQQVLVRGLLPGTTYYFALRVRDDAGNWSGLSNVVRWDSEMVTEPPPAPAGLAAQPGGAGVRVTWSPGTAPDLAGYSVYRATRVDGPFAKLNLDLLVAAEYQDDALPTGVDTLWYQVTASNVSGNESARSESVWVRIAVAPPPPPPPPAAPAGLAALLRGAGVHLTWNPGGSPRPAGYSVYRATAADGPFAKLGAGLVGTAEYQDDALPPGAPSLWYRVTASDTSGRESAPSASITVMLESAPPATPAGLSAQRSGAGVRLAWTPSGAPDLAGYWVYRASSAAGPFTRLNPSHLDAAEYQDDALPAGAASLWYQVTASSAGGAESARSASVSVPLAAESPALAWFIAPAYPNPSRISDPVRIPVDLGPAGGARVDIVDAAGQLVRRLDLAGLASGHQEIEWDGRNGTGRDVAPGPYRAWLIAGDLRRSIRLVRVP